MNNSEALIF